MLSETAAIALHLCDRHPAAGLAPPLASPERAAFYKWLIFLTNTIQAEQLVYFYPERHTAEPAAVPGIRARAEERLAGMFDVVEAALAAGGPYLAGAAPTAADHFLLMVTRWGRVLARPPRSLPAIGRHAAAMLARPAVRRAFESEGLAQPWA